MTADPACERLLLASTSPYRARLLHRLGIPFASVASGTDETRRDGEAARALAERLARAKTLAVAARYPAALVVGSDQSLSHGGRVLGKPGTRDNAERQLRQLSGSSVTFETAICLAQGESGLCLRHCDTTRVVFRTLTVHEIRRYLEREPALDCAGSFKCEGLGIALFEAIHSDDPTALVGLPLIALTGLLRQAGLNPLG